MICTAHEVGVTKRGQLATMDVDGGPRLVVHPDHIHAFIETPARNEVTLYGAWGQPCVVLFEDTETYEEFTGMLDGRIEP